MKQLVLTTAVTKPYYYDIIRLKEINWRYELGEVQLVYRPGYIESGQFLSEHVLSHTLKGADFAAFVAGFPVAVGNATPLDDIFYGVLQALHPGTIEEVV